MSDFALALMAPDYTRFRPGYIRGRKNNRWLDIDGVK